MKRFGRICVFFVTTYLGCVITIAIMIIPGLLPNPVHDVGYGLIAPIIMAVSLLITAVPCGLFVSRTGGIRRIIAVGIMQGLLAPIMSILVWRANIPWSTIAPRSGLLLPGILGSIIAFAVAYVLIVLIMKYANVYTTTPGQ